MIEILFWISWFSCGFVSFSFLLFIFTDEFKWEEIVISIILSCIGFISILFCIFLLLTCVDKKGIPLKTKAFDVYRRFFKDDLVK